VSFQQQDKGAGGLWVKVGSRTGGRTPGPLRLSVNDKAGDSKDLGAALHLFQRRHGLCLIRPPSLVFLATAKRVAPPGWARACSARRCQGPPSGPPRQWRERAADHPVLGHHDIGPSGARDLIGRGPLVEEFVDHTKVKALGFCVLRGPLLGGEGGLMLRVLRKYPLYAVAALVALAVTASAYGAVARNNDRAPALSGGPRRFVDAFGLAAEGR
jgi:hypothetical protein